jgi:nicotinate-nucleotide adenylyltransferase
MTSSQSPVGILGGTFDPIHLGHLAVAEAACAALGLAEVLFIPSHHPPHRRIEPHASGYHRFAMLALALADRPALSEPSKGERRVEGPGFLVSDVELLASSWSYTSVTLRRLHEAAFDALQLFFITGADAFAEIASWNDYPAILDLANFAVVSRPGYPAASLPEQLPMLRDRMTMRQAAAVDHAVGKAGITKIWLVQAVTPDVSSTEVRRRARAGESLEGLVPTAVEQYIERHHLYR